MPSPAIVPCLWLGDPPEPAATRDRAFAAILAMGKLDVAALQRAFEGR